MCNKTTWLWLYKSRGTAFSRLRYREDSLSEQHADLLCLRRSVPPRLWGKSPDPAAESASCKRQSLSLGPAIRGVQRSWFAEHFGAGGRCNVEAKLCEWQSQLLTQRSLLSLYLHLFFSTLFKQNDAHGRLANMGVSFFCTGYGSSTFPRWALI